MKIDVSTLRDMGLRYTVIWRQAQDTAFNVLKTNGQNNLRDMAHKHTPHIRGNASFIGATKLSVRQDESRAVKVKGRRILIATGSTAYRLPSIPYDGQRVFDSDPKRLRFLPKAVAILGAGILAVEYASSPASPRPRWLQARLQPPSSPAGAPSASLSPASHRRMRDVAGQRPDSPRGASTSTAPASSSTRNSPPSRGPRIRPTPPPPPARASPRPGPSSSPRPTARPSRPAPSRRPGPRCDGPGHCAPRRWRRGPAAPPGAERLGRVELERVEARRAGVRFQT
jgi:hypothetical protein